MSQRRIDSSKSEMGKGSEHRRVKEKRVSRVQRGTDVSEGEMGRGSECHQVKRKRVKKERASRDNFVKDSCKRFRAMEAKTEMLDNIARKWKRNGNGAGDEEFPCNIGFVNSCRIDF
ncbi:uncharacterized protein [Euphorbia lathyris]|uniref:uncharacterized protein isoform X3 n=1 Tax=Euphorbia lathyris TaxID=212925 RepID=UPI0033135E92